MRSTDFKCTICGKFVSYSDIQNGDVIQEFTPDTHRTIEKMEMAHKKCINLLKERKEAQDENRKEADPDT